VSEPSGEQTAQQVGPPWLIVHILDQRVLDRHTPPRARGITPRSLKHLGDLPTLVDGNKLVAQIIIGRVQGKRKGYREILADKALDRGNKSDC
jgi:hypothetical protein